MNSVKDKHFRKFKNENSDISHLTVKEIMLSIVEIVEKKIRNQMEKGNGEEGWRAKMKQMKK